MRSVVLNLAICAVLVGCAAPINLRNAEAYAQAGYAAQRNGDWETARHQFARAVVNADLGNADPNGRAIVNYEYGRAPGVTCYYAEAEKYLLRSKEFNEQQGRAPFLSLLELGLLNEKQGKAQESSSYFAQLIPLMEKEGLEARYPLGAADVFDRYASTLEAIGKTSEAALQRKRAKAIRASNLDAKPFGSVTPYGTACAKPS